MHTHIHSFRTISYMIQEDLHENAINEGGALVDECEVAATTTLRLLKTMPSPVSSSSSSSESIATTPLLFSRGVSMGEAWAVASGIAAIGAEGVEVPASLAPWRRASASVNLALFSSVSTIPASRQT